MARVIEIRADQPIKPLVKPSVTAHGLKIKEERMIDLAEESSLSIEGAVDECLLKVGDPALHLELKAQKWWL